MYLNATEEDYCRVAETFYELQFCCELNSYCWPASFQFLMNIKTAW